jgi:hypothetical protein
VEKIPSRGLVGNEHNNDVFSPFFQRTLEWLDDPWKQPIVSFASRIPEAFSPGDATTRSIHVNTLRPSVHCLAEYTQHQQQQQQQRNKKTGATPAAEESSGVGAEEQAQQQHQQEMQCKEWH